MRLSPGRLLGCLAVAVLGVLTVVGLYLVAVVDAAGRAVDDALMHRVAELGAGFRGDALRLLDLVSVGSVVLVVVVLAAVALVRRRPARAGVVVAVVLGAQLATQALKAVLPRAGVGENSLPSGHVTVVASLAVVAVLVAPTLLRPVVALLGAGAVAGVGLATMVVEWHRPADVVAALGVVAAATGAALGAELVGQTLLEPRPSPPRRRSATVRLPTASAVR